LPSLAVHPVAALFPMLADDELEELVADIKERGLLQPIVLDAEGRVLDGRNRLKACELAGVKPTFRNLTARTPSRSSYRRT
jgi:ParB-like chromosome segregation protein Spo0J